MVIANLQSQGHKASVSFCQGPSGNGTDVTSEGAVLVVFSFSWQDTQEAMTDFTSASILGQQDKSLSLCLVLTIPWWPSCARCTMWGKLNGKLMFYVVLTKPLGAYFCTETFCRLVVENNISLYIFLFQ